MNSQTDQQLLRDYTEGQSDSAFAELVRRHLDFVYSAALRMVRDRHLAEDVTQGTFVALARNARRLTQRPVLSGWLHRTAQNLAANTVRSDVRRRNREQEAAAMNEILSESSAGVPPAWSEIAPHLDTALNELNEAERDAVLLRYFERKSARDIAQTLGISDEAAQKRISRAVERLREIFFKRGITIGGSGLVILISANAVQAAPAAIAAMICSAAASGTAATTSTVIAATTKTIAMTTFQKTLVVATMAALAGASLYEAHQAAQLREQIQTLQQQQSPLVEQVQQLQNNFFDTTNRLADLLAENSRLKSDSPEAELMKLRGEVGVLRQQTSNFEKLQVDNQQLKQHLTETVIGYKQFQAETAARALVEYANNNHGQLPDNFDQVISSSQYPHLDATSEKFEILYHGSLDALTNSDVILFREKNLWRTANGRLGRFDVLANGRAQYGSAPDGTSNEAFSEWEREHLATATNQYDK